MDRPPRISISRLSHAIEERINRLTNSAFCIAWALLDLVCPALHDILVFRFYERDLKK
jgi:hypothetical protein